MTTALSILDLAPIARGQSAADSITASVALAQRAEELGYRRVWYAEHHNIAEHRIFGHRACSSPTSARRRARFASVRAASCSPTTRR